MNIRHFLLSSAAAGALAIAGALAASPGFAAELGTHEAPVSVIRSVTEKILPAVIGERRPPDG